MSRLSINTSPGKRTTTPKKLNSPNVKLVPAYSPDERYFVPRGSRLEKSKTMELFHLKVEDDIEVRLKTLGDALYRLSVTNNDVEDVIDSIIRFGRHKTYDKYQPTSILNLCYTAKKCPADTLLLTLAIGAIMVCVGNRPSNSEMKEFYNLAVGLRKRTHEFTLYSDNPRKGRDTLEKIINIFRLGKRTLDEDIEQLLGLKEKFIDLSDQSAQSIESMPSEQPVKPRAVVRVSFDEKALICQELLTKPRDDALEQLVSIGDIEYFKTFANLLKNENSKVDLSRYAKIAKEWFSIWDTAYQGVLYVWDQFIHDTTFEIVYMFIVTSEEYTPYMFIGLMSLAQQYFEQQAEN